MTRLLVTGAAGLVGQNPIPALVETGRYEIAAVDKHLRNTEILAGLHLSIAVLREDRFEVVVPADVSWNNRKIRKGTGSWSRHLPGQKFL